MRWRCEFRTACVFNLLLVLALVGCIPEPVQAADAIPHAAARYRGDLTRNARLIWGLEAPVATLAGQIHQESAWRATAQSKYAAGLAQFTPDTAKWICGAYPSLGDMGCDRMAPAWAIRALVTYDLHLFDRIDAANACERMAMALSAYNGGLGWLNRDKRLASAKGADELSWFGEVERFNAGRADWAFTENRGYPRAILRRWEPLYQAAGWGIGVCDAD
ncbi:transglycosylase SLT domain-containing protein [Methylococcus mesophilus]|uniref:transglycosylase SLT domain-containing protein n=1 Tax=Methylococcus mesophilus TaxID=2993564 RepID=UPI00224A9FDB|nr:transglycosylase SLT domain-containing protein [Methylococcus mesophilus]UZR27445.1 transglycosylase SLT domain-containing protein [Methylococcus mesophilus]